MVSPNMPDRPSAPADQFVASSTQSAPSISDSVGSRQTLLYITATWPFRSGSEVFFVPELKELRAAGIEIKVVPRDVPRQRAMVEVPEALSPCISGEPLFSFRVLWASLLETTRNPLRFGRSLRMLFSSIDLHVVRNL